MSEDSAERTEEPTARRLKRARDEGQVARSQELPAAGVMIGAVLMLISLGGVWFHQLSVYFAAGFTLDRKFLDTPALLPMAFATQAMHGFLLVLPLMLVTVVVAILASGATGGFLFSWSAILPKFSKLDPIAGIQRIFGSHAAVELIKSVLKFTLIAVVLVMLLDRHFAALLSLGGMGLAPALALAGSLVSESVLWLTLSLVLIALIDAPYQRYSFMKRMRMSKQEIRDEHKDMEGRPEVKAQIRRRQREVATVRMMQKVKDADVIITNPEHFAIALSYDPTADGAPILLAKGADFVAARIREEAKTNHIEIFQAPELARALYFTTELDQPIPEALYFAVAQVIAYVFSLAQVQPGVDPMARPTPKIPTTMLFDADGKQLSPEAAA
ncbi:MAG: flagellar biosynthesis protein FlhB [Rhodoferax sp.]|nr:flagellar biosynthesis protein FlhB [Rhodoferax sp.]